MSEKESKFKFWDKLKKIKHIEIYIAIIFIVILLLIYLSTSSTKGSSTKNQNTNDLSVSAYVNDLETNLEKILSNIAGVSNVQVMITLDMSSAEVNNSQITLNGVPKIKGVVVTAKGVSNTKIKLQVLQAVEAVLDITNGNIQILSSE